MTYHSKTAFHITQYGIILGALCFFAASILGFYQKDNLSGFYDLFIATILLYVMILRGGVYEKSVDISSVGSLSIPIANYFEVNGEEKTIKILCRTLSLIAEEKGSFNVEDPSNGVLISIELPEN